MLNLDTMAPIYIVPVCDCIQCCWIWWRQCQIHLVICSIRKSGHSITYCTALQFPSTIYCTFSCLEAWVISVCILSFYPELVCNNFTSKQKVSVKELLLSMCQWSEWNSISVAWVGLVRAMPPGLAGRAKRSCSISLGGGLPVSAGVSLVLMIISRGKRLGPLPCIVRVR